MSKKPKPSVSVNTTDFKSSLNKSEIWPSSVDVVFQEWIDHDVNNENWDDKSSKYTFAEGKFSEYKDPQQVHLPPSLPMMEWRRTREVYQEADFVIYFDATECPDIVSKNSHLLQSEFMRSFISSIRILWFLGDTDDFSYEFTSSSFSTDSVQPWRPWHHIYSRNKAGRGNQYNPVTNKIGKYIVRLFWLGSWRKIYVDDMVPIDKSNRVMLPIVESYEHQPAKNSHKKDPRKVEAQILEQMQNNDSLTNKTVELWPLLLCKALMKIASLSWYGKQELIDFDIIQCLTGWIPQIKSLKELNFDEIWNVLINHTDQYEWPDEIAGHENKKHQKSISSAAKEVLSQKKNIKKYIVLACYQENINDFYKTDTKWYHRVLIHLTRNKPLVRPTRPLDYPLWKRYRWLECAASEGLIPPTESSVPIKILRILDPFNKICNPESTTEEKIHRKLLGNNETLSQNAKNQTKLLQISSPLKSKRLTITNSNSDCSWINFDNISPNMKFLIIYIKSSALRCKIKVSEEFPHQHRESRVRLRSTDDQSRDQSIAFWKEIYYPMTLKPQRNEPLYIFSDGIGMTRKTLVLNFSQPGYQETLKIPEENETNEQIELKINDSEDSECGICLTTLFNRFKAKKNSSRKKPEVEVERENIFENPDHPRVKSHLVLERYEWQTQTNNAYFASISTYGSSTMTIHLKPGRHILKLYIKSEGTYRLFLVSDDGISIGNLYFVLNFMQVEPSLLTDYCQNISKKIGKLLKSFGKNNFQENLRDFYISLRPHSKLSRQSLNNVYESFLCELLKTVKKYLGGECENHLKILFRRWQKPLVETCAPNRFCYPIDEEDGYLVQEMEAATIKLQSFFRGCHERVLLRFHDPENRQYKKIVDSISLIQDEIISEESELMPFIVKQALKSPLMENIAPLYPLYEHINVSINLQEVNDIYCKNAFPGWIFICQQPFFVEEPLLLKICLFSDMSQYFVRTFDNDTKMEMRYSVNNVATNTYLPNSQGYTIVCYGYDDQIQLFNCRLLLITEKYPSCPIKLIPSRSEFSSLVGSYIPNVNNIVCRCVLQVSSNISAAIRLITSFNYAKIYLKILDPSGVICSETLSVGDAIIPIIFLEGKGEVQRDSSDIIKKQLKRTKSPKRRSSIIVKSLSVSRNQFVTDRAYTIEATVLEDTWPLTAEEWKTISKVKAEKSYGNKNLKPIHSRKKNPDHIDPPYWMVQVIANNEDTIQLQRDTRREEEIMKLKTEWFETPDRYETAQKLRLEFLQENSVPNPKRISDYTTRVLKPDMFEDKVLPPLDIDEFRKRNSFDSNRPVTLKTKSTLEKEVQKEHNAIKDFEIKAEQMANKLNRITVEQKKMFDIRSEWFKKCRKESAEMMTGAHNLRLKYIEQHNGSIVIKKTKVASSHRSA